MFSRVFFSAVHRPMFFCGAMQSVLAMMFWGADLGARRAGLWDIPAWPVPPAWLHGLITIYGVFPFFMFGFILTAGPRWQGYPETPSRIYVPAFWLLLAGWAAAWMGVLVFPALLPAGLCVVLAGWLVVIRHIVRIASWPNRERRHIRAVALAFILGASGLAAFALHAMTGASLLARLAINLGLWGCLVPVFIVVVHRMLPFFSMGVIPGFVSYRSYWTLWTLLIGSMGHGLLSFFDFPEGTWVFDLPAGLVAAWLSVKWRFRDSFAETLLSVLHVAFAWCSLSFLLFALSSFLILTGQGGLGFAPLHALSLGFLVSMLIGMASRVTLGHSGQPLVGDRTMWVTFWIMQAAAVMRIAGEFVHLPAPFDLSFIASLLALLAFIAWTVKYAPFTWRPLPDAQAD